MGDDRLPKPDRTTEPGTGRAGPRSVLGRALAGVKDRPEVKARAALAIVVASCVAVTTVAVTGTEANSAATRFAQSGHYVYNSTLGKVFGIDGGTKNVGTELEVPGAGPGARVVGTDKSGFVLSQDRTIEFGKSDLRVGDPLPSPAKEQPLGLEAAGSAFAVYRQAGKLQRFGEHPVVVDAGGPIGRPVVTSDGTLWVHVWSSGQLCRLANDSERLSCPARIPGGQSGAITLVGDRPVFVDTGAREMRTLDADGLGRSVPLTGLDVRPTSLVAPNDINGRIAILTKDRLHFVDAKPLTEGRSPDEPMIAQLKPGRYEQLESSGESLAMIDAADGSLVTFDADGRLQERRRIPGPSKAAKVRATDRPVLFRGGDSRLYVDSSSGEHVMVVDGEGEVTDVEAVGRGDRPGGDPTRSPKKPETRLPVEPPKTKRPVEPKTQEPVQPPRTQRPVQPAETERPRSRPTRRPVEPPRTDPPEPPSIERPSQDPTRKPPRRPTQRPTERPTQKATQKPTPPPPPPTRPTVKASKPGAAGNVTAASGNAQVTVTWGAASANGAPITSYTVSWAGQTRTFAASARRTVVTQLDAGTHTFMVRAKNRVGTGPGVSAKAMLAGPPDAPGNFRGTGQSDAVQLTWNRPSMNGGSFLSYAVTLVGSDEDSKDTRIPSLRWTGLRDGTRYTFQVRAVTMYRGSIAQMIGKPATVTVTAGAPTGGGGVPKVVISKGAAYDGDPDICDPAHCAYTRIWATNLRPNTTYVVSGYATDYTLHEGDKVLSSSSGTISLDEKFYNAAIGQDVWVIIKDPEGKATRSNNLRRTS